MAAGVLWAALDRVRAAQGGRIEQPRAELAGVERRLRKIVDAIADGVPAGTLKDELPTLGPRQGEMQALLAKPEPDRPHIQANVAGVYQRKVSALHEALANEASRADAMELIPSLIDAIVLVPEDGSLRVELRSKLAGILALAATIKKPGLRDRACVGQIKIVAGTRNQRYLQISLARVPLATDEIKPKVRCLAAGRDSRVRTRRRSKFHAIREKYSELSVLWRNCH